MNFLVNHVFHAFAILLRLAIFVIEDDDVIHAFPGNRFHYIKLIDKCLAYALHCGQMSTFSPPSLQFAF